MKHTLYRIVTKVTIFATVFLTVLGTLTPAAYAAAFETVRMELSRTQVSQAVSSTFSIDLPGTVDWDATTASDTIVIAYPTSSATWVFTTPNWTYTDFLIYDGTQQVTVGAGDVSSSTVSGVNFSDATVSCVAAGSANGANNAHVFINTTDLKFYFRRCSGGVLGADPGDGAEIEITIKSGGLGTLTTPSSAANNVLVSVDMSNEDTEITHSDLIATSIIPADAAGPSAVAPTAPTMTFVVASDPMASNAAAACSGATAFSDTASSSILFTSPISVTAVQNATGTICTSVTAAATAATVRVAVYSANGGLKNAAGIYLASDTSSSDYAASSQKTLIPGVSTDDGMCIMDNGDAGGTSSESGTITGDVNFDGNCDFGTLDANQVLGTIPTLASGGLTPLWTSTPDGSAQATHLLPRISASTATDAGTYFETYYFVASAAF